MQSRDLPGFRREKVLVKTFFFHFFLRYSMEDKIYFFKVYEKGRGNFCKAVKGKSRSLTLSSPGHTLTEMKGKSRETRVEELEK